MAAGVIYQTVTTTTGETVELAFYVDNTASPTTWIPVSVGANTSGAPIAFGSGANGTTVPRFALATDSPGVTTLGQATSTASLPVVLSSDFTGTSGFMKKEDVASADGDAGVAMLVVRKATPANTSGTDGDYEFPQISAGSMWVASVATDKTLISERVIAGGSQYETVAASQTDQILGATGAAGDYVEGLICVVATAATSQVQVKDGNGSAITVLPNAVGAGVGTYYVPLGLICINATTPGWKVTTAAGVSVVGTGRFT